MRVCNSNNYMGKVQYNVSKSGVSTTAFPSILIVSLASFMYTCIDCTSSLKKAIDSEATHADEILVNLTPCSSTSICRKDHE